MYLVDTRLHGNTSLLTVILMTLLSTMHKLMEEMGAEYRHTIRSGFNLGVSNISLAA
jgi:hypothetical protein